MKDVAEIIRAIAALLWPVFAFVMLVVYRDQLRRVLDRFRRGKFFGQELELEAIAADAKTRPLSSAVATENLVALLESEAFRERIASIVKTESKPGEQNATEKVVEVVKAMASKSVREAFLKVDTRPLLGAHGAVWEEPYEEHLTVRKLLDRIWFLMHPHVKPYRYPDGWVLRNPTTGQMFTDIGRNWARRQGQSDDERQLMAVGIEPGSTVEVVPGPRVNEALSGDSSILNLT